MSWTSHETWLVACTLLSIACIVLLISYCKVHAFIALVLGSGVVGLASELKAGDVIKQFQSGDLFL
jgi:GntP family gluconate:H+ symporter